MCVGNPLQARTEQLNLFCKALVQRFSACIRHDQAAVVAFICGVLASSCQRPRPWLLNFNPQLVYLQWVVGILMVVVSIPWALMNKERLVLRRNGLYCSGGSPM